MDVRDTWKVLLISAAVLSPIVACAADTTAKTTPTTASGMRVTVFGENYCLGCALKKEHGAAAQCSKYGHRHSLRVEKAVDASGREMAELAGRTLGYLENDKSEQLLKGEGFHERGVEVKGRLFPRESVIEVQEYKAR